MKAVISNVSPEIDGEYEFELDKLNTADWRIIKVHTGLVMGEIPDAFERGDLDAPFGLALAALNKHGIRVTKHLVEQLSNADLGSIRLDLSDNEAEAEPDRPPVSPPESGESPSTGDEPAGSESRPSSAATSNGSSESSEKTPSPTGSPGSVIGSPV